jgi:hypothetical protein
MPSIGNFNINNVLSEVQNRGVLKPSKFSLSCGLPPALSGTAAPLLNAGLISQISTNPIVSLWCEQTVIPGASLDVTPVRRYGYGPVEKKPFGVQYADAQVVFRADAQGLIHGFLHAWMCAAIPYNYGAADMTSRIGASPGQHAYEVAYKDDYAQSVNITQYDDTGNAIIQVTLREAYPIFVADAPVSWASRGDYSRFAANFTFLSWFTSQPPAAQSNMQTTAPGSTSPSLPVDDGSLSAGTGGIS